MEYDEELPPGEEFMEKLKELLAERGVFDEDVEPDQIAFTHAPPTRPDEIEDPEWVPTEKEDIEALRYAPDDFLEAVGMQVFRTYDDGAVLWLFPVHWYEHLPEEIEVCMLWREKETFDRDEFMKEARWGALPFGILRTTSESTDEQ